VNLFSRRSKSFNTQYPHILEALQDLPKGTVIDGEVVALDDEGLPNFNLLQQFRRERKRICYFVFDLLVCEHRDLTGLPLSDRRELLKTFLTQRSPQIRISEQFVVAADDMLAAIRQQRA
jgi:bifunctional non-homologous end joining protein LigD